MGTGATGEALAGLEDSFKAVFSSVPVDAADASTAIADLNTRLGLTGDDLEIRPTQFLGIIQNNWETNVEQYKICVFGLVFRSKSGGLDYL